MQISRRATAVSSGLAMAASTWIASFVWFLNVAGQGASQLPFPEDWLCLGSGLIFSQIAQLVFISGPILFFLGWLWGNGWYARQARFGLIIASAFILGLAVPVSFCRTSFGLITSLFVLLILGALIAVISLIGQVKIRQA